MKASHFLIKAYFQNKVGSLVGNDQLNTVFLLTLLKSAEMGGK